MKLRCIILAVLLSGILNAKIQFNHTWDTYGTHQPMLYMIATNTTGPIIEFGCGNSSTDLLHEICKKTKRLLITIDDNQEWLNKFSQKYLGDGYAKDNSGWHKFFFVPGKHDHENPDHWIKFLESFELLNTVNFDLCFIDQSPWLARTATILRLKDTVRYIVLHDCDGYAAEPLGLTIKPLDAKKQIPGIYDFSKTFHYFKVYFPPRPWAGETGPPTLVGSNFESTLLVDIDYANLSKK